MSEIEDWYTGYVAEIDRRAEAGEFDREDEQVVKSEFTSWLALAWIGIKYGVLFGYERFNQWCDNCSDFMDSHIVPRLIAFYLMVLFFLWLFSFLAGVMTGNIQRAMYAFMIALTLIAAGLSTHDVIDTFRKRDERQDEF